jgi:hypothetical protein
VDARSQAAIGDNRLVPDQEEASMASDHRIDELNDGQLLYIALDPDGVWARSEFPHPLITVDYDADDNVIGISPAGPHIDPTLEAYREWRKSGQDPSQLIAELGHTSRRVPA